ncbi:MAG TPA: histidine kinase, partial [Novosphingobium sp.]
EQRIASLAANQDLLVRRAWTDVPVGELVEVQLGFLGEAIGQVSREGPVLPLTPSAAETIGMAMHELATNAVKYGSLSLPTGRVLINWRRSREGGLELTWREQDGPPVSAPQAAGFGSRLIIDLPRTKLQADVAADYAPDGFSWRIVTPAGMALA